ncbi:amidohydrolase [Lactobacillus sp. S2-2]|uniref:N-acetyldiaminopimelate deacetylase n=1 Tax=Lactobacillus sp. S2-2 TaxID=2692917 RepID=UPI001F41AC6E|nr:N-acetyldiaminopimelate deacetylase [Lactobacillus sp. S2-2]MCF6514924.1 amidohydrolase [Lactobacillus sp. S2-2]
MQQAELFEIYRHLHQYPELAMEEFKTHEFLLNMVEKIKNNNWNVRTISDLPTAILVYIPGINPSKTIGYRTDIDALPVQEATNIEFKSKNEGKMHACGHDLHMTVALGVLDYFAKNQPKDNLIFFFQPAEESQNGGKIAYDLGVFEGKWKPDEFYALHDNPQLDTGVIGSRVGTLFAGTTEVDVELIGKSGHAAYPQNARDMVVAGSEFINQIQNIISRKFNPMDNAVITFGKFESGSIRNVISGYTKIEGTIRALTQNQIEYLQQQILQVKKGIEILFDCEVKVKLNQGGYYPVENNFKLSTDFCNYMEENQNVNFEMMKPAMTGEDFGYLLNKFPGVMFWLGVSDPNNSLHSDKFLPNINAIASGINAITGYLEHRMEE